MTKEKDACPKPASKQFQGTGSTKLAVLDEKTSAGSQEIPGGDIHASLQLLHPLALQTPAGSWPLHKPAESVCLCLHARQFQL